MRRLRRFLAYPFRLVAIVLGMAVMLFALIEDAIEGSDHAT